MHLLGRLSMGAKTLLAVGLLVAMFACITWLTRISVLGMADDLRALASADADASQDSAEAMRGILRGMRGGTLALLHADKPSEVEATLASAGTSLTNAGNDLAGALRLYPELRATLASLDRLRTDLIGVLGEIGAANRAGQLLAHRPALLARLDALAANRQLMDQLPIEMRRVSSARSEAKDVEIHTMLDRMLVGTGLAAVFGMVVAWAVLSFGVARPMQSLAGTARKLSEGDYAVAVPGTGRADEVGMVADALLLLRDAAARARELEAASATQREEAERQRVAAQHRVADQIEGTTGEVVTALGGSVQQLGQVIETLGSTALRTSEQAQAVAAGASQASANVQTVASAAEELASSVAEIGRQVAQSAEVAQRAVEEARQTDVTVTGLAEAASRIDGVLRLIGDIAGQTNLLALNATIEAARAGEAGKGFAVVASEVKQLAAQTAKATEEIGAQIAGVQAATDHAVRSIRGIGQVVGEINHISAAIAAAVEEQGAATREIARNVAEAAAGTNEVSANIARVNEGVASNSSALASMREATGRVSQGGDALRGRLAGLVGELRRGA